MKDTYNPRGLPGPTILISPGPDKNHVYLMLWLYRKSRDVGFYSRYVKNDVTLCKLDVNVKKRTAVAGSVDFFKLK